jgi:hypothetical protein
MEPTREQVEHIEHTQHAAHGGTFDRRVATTMAIIAAMLAAETMLSHRAHNDTLRFQTEADILHTQANDEWSYYQAKNIRRHAYQSNLAMLELLTRSPGSDERYQALRAEWEKQLADYKSELPPQKEKAEHLTHEAEQRMAKSEEAHHKGDRFDIGELAVELGLVLCSLAVLTKRAPFWYVGMAAAAIGAVVGVSAFLVH